MGHVPPTTATEQRELVRRGYDSISRAYRSDDGASNPTTAETTETYAAWLEELAGHLGPGAEVLDIGCGVGVPADRWLADAGFRVTGIDISEVQIERARRLVPSATFVRADISVFDAADASFDAVVSFYALIHVPLEDQRALFPRIHRWLRPGGLFLAIVGNERWTAVEDYHGAPMFWDHADTCTYLRWLAADGFAVQWSRFVPREPVDTDSSWRASRRGETLSRGATGDRPREARAVAGGVFVGGQLARQIRVATGRVTRSTAHRRTIPQRHSRFGIPRRGSKETATGVLADTSYL